MRFSPSTGEAAFNIQPGVIQGRALGPVDPAVPPPLIPRAEGTAEGPPIHSNGRKPWAASEGAGVFPIDRQLLAGKEGPRLG